MRNCLCKWNFKKHFVVVTILYSALFSIGNAVFINKNCRKRKAKKQDSKKDVKQDTIPLVSVGQKTFNCLLLTCYTIDLASYGLIKYYQNKLEQNK